MTEGYKLADLSEGEMREIEQLESRLGLTLIAWEPEKDLQRRGREARRSEEARQP